MLAGVGLDLDYQRLFGLAGSQAIASIEDEIGLVQLTGGDRSQPLVRAAYLQLHRVCRHPQAIRRQSCAHTFSAEIALIEPKNPLFSMRRPSRARPNMPTDRKLGADDAGYSGSEKALKRNPLGNILYTIQLEQSCFFYSGSSKLRKLSNIMNIPDDA